MVFDGCRGWGHAAHKFFHRESWNWIKLHSSLLMCHVSMLLAPFARWNEGFSCALLIYLILGTGTCSSSTGHLCDLFCIACCTFFDLILQVLLLAHLFSWTLVVQLYHESVCAFVVASCMFAFSSSRWSLVMLQYYKMLLYCHLLF